MVYSYLRRVKTGSETLCHVYDIVLPKDSNHFDRMLTAESGITRGGEAAWAVPFLFSPEDSSDWSMSRLPVFLPLTIQTCDACRRAAL